MKILATIIKILLPVMVIIGGVVTWKKFKELPQKKQEVAPGRIQSTNKLTQEERKALKEQGIPVVAHRLSPQEHQVIITSRGTSEAGEDLPLTTEVEGQVMHISEKFEPGAIVKKGAILLTVDDADLQDNLIVTKARVAQAEASLAQEEVRAAQALVNWNELGYQEKPSDLVLRKPQLRQAKANLDAAVAQVELAKRQLERVNLIAPFDGIIAERTITVGERATRGRSVGRLISTGYSNIDLQVSAEDRTFLPSDIKGAEIEFTNALLREESKTWSGHAVGLNPEVDPASKQLSLITRVTDPYSLTEGSGHTLPVGQPVAAKIKGKVLKDVYIVPKTALRAPNKIHIMTSDKVLSSLEVQPILTDRENIIFRAEIAEGAHWVETVLPSWKEGHLLRLEPPQDEQKSTPQKKEKL